MPFGLTNVPATFQRLPKTLQKSTTTNRNGILEQK